MSLLSLLLSANVCPALQGAEVHREGEREGESEGDFVRFNDKYRLRKRRGEKGERAERDRVTQLLKHDIKRGRGRIRGMRKIVNILTREGGAEEA